MLGREKDGAREAAYQAFSTFIISVVIQFVMVSNFALLLIETSPLLMPAATGVAIAFLGRYRGLRLSEIGRFAPIWLERRRAAREVSDPDQLELDLRPPTPEEARERAPPLEGMWVINSPKDLEPFARRQVPQPRPEEEPVKPNSEAQFEPRIGTFDGASGSAPTRPKKHNAWIIKSAEDV